SQVTFLYSRVENTTMNATTAVNVLQWYESLETQVMHFMQVVPPQGANLSAWSPTLATVLVEACNLLESVLYHITPDPVALPGSGKRTPRDSLTLAHYAALYSSKLRLPERKAAFFQEPFGWRTPFSGWAGRSTNFQNPLWWEVHNRSKHRR